VESVNVVLISNFRKSESCQFDDFVVNGNLGSGTIDNAGFVTLEVVGWADLWNTSSYASGFYSAVVGATDNLEKSIVTPGWSL
jgi:hypothetical protein